jgi:hypothetical protein
MRFVFVLCIALASFHLAEAQSSPPRASLDVQNVPETQATRQLATYELVKGPVEPAPDCECYVWTDCWCTTLPIAIDATGYSKIGAFVRTDDAGYAVFELLWRWSPDEPFRRVNNAFSGAPFRGNSGEPFVYPGIGGTVALHVEWYTGTVIESARVYLIN